MPVAALPGIEIRKILFLFFFSFLTVLYFLIYLHMYMCAGGGYMHMKPQLSDVSGAELQVVMGGWQHLGSSAKAA